MACERVLELILSLRAELVMDGEKFELVVSEGARRHTIGGRFGSTGDEID